MGDVSGGANTADSYIGSLISLTSKSEIRYEGILYTVDTENSNIALQNVRSFGTEGRKKDGLPILASDKVYDYIIFRGSDIKDLQVKSSPSIQPPPQPPTDPAIISLQSQYSQPAPITPAYVQPPPGPQDAVPQLPYPGNFPSAFRSGVPPLYQHQPTAGLGSWGPPPPPPGPNGTGLAMPMYWQAGYYRPPTAQPILQQPLHPQPPPSLPMPPALQPQVLQQPPRPSPPLNLISSMPPVTSSLAHSSGSVSSSISAAAPPVTGSTPVSVSSVSLSAPGSTPAVSAAVSATVTAPSSGASSVPTSIAPSAVQGVSAVITPAAKNPRRAVGPVQPSPPQSQSSGASVGTTSTTASALTTSASAASAQRLQTTSQPLPGMLSSAPGKNAVTNQPKPDQKAAEPAKTQMVAATSGQAPQQQTQPLLPLPTSSTPQKQLLQGNGSIGSNYVRRGRGRGSGSGRGIGLAHPTQQFMEDFDFTAMNEKFNKDEVWGELGKGSEVREKVGDTEEEDLADGHAEDEVADGAAHKIVPDMPKKPVYVKDDFFDSLSCDALDREEGRAERTKFSEQRKIDTETFGNFPLRSRGGRGGRGRRGGFRGGFYGGGYMGGRGNGYGRGRGAPRSATAIN